ncbi:MAG: 1-(5-phosphoribosyl)-5-[(5-phosphoribosylamino)methylideneamino]imidazole-4-carboxamide isomerase [Syntrophaceae bacterium]|nr:1-(5-phosphoribosyl)-5-[(5-phosphoribosylamino)methylideneamino]imidazole-4-carboxamide isomerase [Syntrophaceae bacterium]
MIIIPAIDLHEGKCVRLLQGDFNRVTIYADDPVAMAVNWQDQGAERLHIVDLDGSRTGSPQNRDIILDIARTLRIPVEVGGGIRSMKTIDGYLRGGVKWVILGTAAIRDGQLLRDACHAYRGHIILGLDAKDGQVAVQGWTETTTLSVRDVVDRFRDYGLSAIIYTDIARDGMQTGVNIEATKRLAQMTNIPVIASGGVSDINDVEKVLQIESDGVIGVIAGKALYAGTLNLKKAIGLAGGNRT